MSHSLLMVDLRGVLIHFRPLNDLSGDQDVTGSVQSIWSKTVMFGNSKDV